MKFDYETEMFKIKRNKKIAWFLAIIIFLLFVSSIILLLVFSSYENRFLIKLIGIPLLSLILIFLSFEIYSYLVKTIQKEKSMYNILYGYQEEVSGEVIEIKENVHLPLYKEGYQVVIKQNEEKKTLYIPMFVNNIDIKVGQYIKFEIAKSFIISYEVKQK